MYSSDRKARASTPLDAASATKGSLSDLLNRTPAVQAQLALGETLNHTVQRQENRTGLPDAVKSGIENLSGRPLDGVRVHYNSAAPAQLNALAYTQGTDIHVAPGQQKQVAHEAWHVVQQMEGRVRPTMQLRGVGINDDDALEKEADVMGARAAQLATVQRVADDEQPSSTQLRGVLQAKWVDAGGPIQQWDEPMDGRQWFYDTETQSMWFKYVEKPATLMPDEEALAGKQLTYGEWLDQGWGLFPSRGAESDDIPSYDTLVNEGKKRYATMQKKLKEGGGTIDPRTQKARDDYFARYYKTGEREDWEPSSMLMISDFKHRPGATLDGNYNNLMDLESGHISALNNHALAGGEMYYDPVSGMPAKMSNSEVLFQQWRMAAAVNGRQTQPLKTVKRSKISGDRGWRMSKNIVVALFGKNTVPEDTVYQAGSEGFNALLALPNVTSSIWLVADHGAELGIAGIESITLLKDRSVLIAFAQAVNNNNNTEFKNNRESKNNTEFKDEL